MLAPAPIAALLASCGAAPDVAGHPAGSGRAYRYEYAVTLPVDAIAGVQRRHAAACARLGSSRCRIRALQRTVGGGNGGLLTLEVARGTAPAVIADLLGAVAEAGGSQRSGEVTVQDVSRPAGGRTPGPRAAIVPITLHYSGIRGFSEQVAEALAAFLPGMADSAMTLVAMFPALLPWLIVLAALLFAGDAMLRRRREKRR